MWHFSRAPLAYTCKDSGGTEPVILPPPSFSHFPPRMALLGSLWALCPPFPCLVPPCGGSVELPVLLEHSHWVLMTEVCASTRRNEWEFIPRWILGAVRTSFSCSDFTTYQLPVYNLNIFRVIISVSIKIWLILWVRSTHILPDDGISPHCEHSGYEHELWSWIQILSFHFIDLVTLGKSFNLPGEDTAFTSEDCDDDVSYMCGWKRSHCMAQGRQRQRKHIGGSEHKNF